MIIDKPTMRFFVVLALLVICSSLIRLFHYAGPMAFDEQKWIIAAQFLLGQDVPEIHPVYHSRILWSIILAGWGTLFGWSWTSIEFLVFILSAGTIIAITLATREFFSSRAGLLGGAFYAFHPINIVYDTAAIPDSLAVFLTAISLLFFGRYLRSFCKRELVFTGLMVGLLFSIKVYYILYAVPLGLIVLFFRTETRRVNEFLALVVAVLTGLGLSLLLGFFFAEDFLISLSGSSDYAERIRADTVYVGFRAWIHLILERVDYLNDLLYQYSGAFGLLTLWITGILAMDMRHSRSAFLFLSITIFLLFLMFMPASIHPLIFVETQTRYLTVVLIPLSIGAGYALDRITIELQNTHLSGLGLLVFVAALGLNAWDANGRWDRYQLMELSGIQSALKIAQQEDFTAIAVPKSFVLGVPDMSHDREGTKIELVPFGDPDVDNVLKFLAENPKEHAAFIPRRHYRAMIKDLRFDSVHNNEVSPDLLEIVSALELAGIERMAITVPYRSLEARLETVGIKTRGQLVGWLYYHPTD